MRWDGKNNAVGFGCYPGTEGKCVRIADDWKLIAKEIVVDGKSIQEIVNNQSSNIIASETSPESPVAGMIWLDIS